MDGEAIELRPAGQDETVEYKPDKKLSKKVSLVRAMGKVFWPQFLLAILLKVAHDVIIFMQPYLLE